MNIEHHALILRDVSPCSAVLPAVETSVERYITVLDRFGIDDARSLMQRAYQRPVDETRQQLVVQTTFITHEAQNALLKVLEEPPQSTTFLFVVPPDLSLLPTLASRFQMASGRALSNEQNEVFVTFLEQSYGDRIAAIETASKKKDTDWQRAIKQGLIAHVARLASIAALAELEFVARTLLTRGAANKMLLEQVALSLPVSSERH